MLYLLLAAEEGEEEAINPILPAIGEIFWGALAFATLFVLIRYVLLPPVQRVMHDRAATIQADLDAAAAAKAKATSASSELDDQLAGVRGEAASIIEEARAEAEAERQRLVARADREVSAMKEIAETEIDREREEAMTALRPQVAQLAAGAASKVMNRQVDPSQAQSVINRAMDNSN